MKTQVVVIGLGTIGSMVAWQLARRGVDVVAVEQYGVAHARGSYAGDSRLFRMAVHEGERYVPLLKEAHELWRTLERDSGMSLLEECGALTIGEPGNGSLQNAIDSATNHDLPHEILTAADLRSRYPQHDVDDHTLAILDKQGGSLRPEAAVFAAAEMARSHGATILTEQQVVDFDEVGDAISVSTTDTEILTDKIVLTTGSWTTQLRPDLKGLLQLQPVDLTWFMPRHIDQFRPEVFPSFIRDRRGVHLYGTPTHDGLSVKIAAEPQWLPVSSPDALPSIDRAHLRKVGGWVHSFLPDLSPEPVKYSMHHELNTPTGLPLIDLDDDGRVLMMTAFSGRGAKFAPAYGKLAADLLTDTPTALFDPGFTLAAHKAR